MPTSSIASLWTFGGFAKSLGELSVDVNRSKLQPGSRMLTFVGAQFFDREMRNPLFNFSTMLLPKSLVPWAAVQKFKKDDDMTNWVTSFPKLKASTFKDAIDRFPMLDARTLQISHYELTSSGDVRLLSSGGMVGVTTTSENTTLALPGVDPIMEVIQNSSQNSTIVTTNSGGAAGFAALAVEEMLGSGKIQTLIANDLTSLARPAQGINALVRSNKVTSAFGLSKGFPAQFWGVILWPEHGGSPSVLSGNATPKSDDPLSLVELWPKQPTATQLSSVDIEDDT